METSNNETQEKKTCGTCKQKVQSVREEMAKSLNNNSKKDKDCDTCKKTKEKMFPYVVLSLLFFGFAVYGVFVFAQKMIELFSK